MLRRLLTPSAKTVIGNNVNCPVRVYIGNVGLAYEDVDIVILCMPVFWIENSERWKRLINLKHMGMWPSLEWRRPDLDAPYTSWGPLVYLRHKTEASFIWMLVPVFRSIFWARPYSSLKNTLNFGFNPSKNLSAIMLERIRAPQCL